MPLRRLPMRSARLLVGLVALIAASPVFAQTARDPVEGLWLGETGSAKERIEVGMEFRRGDDGKLKLLLTQPVSNYFAADVGGDVVRDGDRVAHDGMQVALRLQGDTLVGTYPGPNSPATLRRVSALPQEAAVPAVPTGPGPRWETRIGGGQVFASPVVFDGVAYIGTTGGVFNAVDTRDGKPLWTFSAGAPIFGAAAVDASAVYVASDAGWLYKLDRADGKQRWRYRLGEPVPRILPHPTVFDWDWHAPQPLLADGVVYVGTGDGGFHAVDAATGARRWRFESSDKIRHGAAIDGARVVFGSGAKLHALSRDTGAPAWRFDARAAIDTTPVLHAGRWLVGDRGAGLYSLDAADGKEAWRLYFWGSWVEATPVVVDGVIYIGSSDLRRVSAIDPDTGHVRWRSDVHGWTWGTPLMAGNRLYVGVAGGTPYFVRHLASFNTLDRATGELLTRWPLPDTGGHQWGIAGSPARSGDVVVVATIAGSLYGFPLR